MRMSGRADADKDRETDNLYSEPVIPIRVLRSSSFTFSSFFLYEYQCQAILFPFLLSTNSIEIERIAQSNVKCLKAFSAEIKLYAIRGERTP